jgi:hypothetical protein
MTENGSLSQRPLPGADTHDVVSNDRRRTLRQWWSAITTLLAAAIFIQAVFAGAMLSGVDWARAAHASGAVVLTIAVLAAGLVCIATLRRIPLGLRLGLTLLSLAAAIFLQTAVGKMSMQGANLMWVHVPLGVALIGFAAQAAAAARRLGGE